MLGHGPLCPRAPGNGLVELVRNRPETAQMQTTIQPLMQTTLQPPRVFFKLFESVVLLLESMGQNLVHTGGWGKGQERHEQHWTV